MPCTQDFYIVLVFDRSYITICIFNLKRLPEILERHRIIFPHDAYQRLKKRIIDHAIADIRRPISNYGCKTVPGTQGTG